MWLCVRVVGARAAGAQVQATPTPTPHTHTHTPSALRTCSLPDPSNPVPMRSPAPPPTHVPHPHPATAQILKAFTPALTLLLCVAAGLERLTWPLSLSVLLIAVGTASAVLVESGTAAFSLLGLLSFGASSITEAARVVGAEVLLGSQRWGA